MSHNAIWISSSNELSVRRIEEKYTPLEAQTLVKVAYSGINPADLKHATFLGVNNCVAGYDFSGTVVQAGPGSRFQVGDQVAGLTPAMNPRPHKHGAHQDYLIAPDSTLFAVPPHLPMADAAVLGVVARTAIDALFCGMGLPEPGSSSTSNPGALLVWGGAGGVGTAATQLAAAVGLSPILVTASPRNHEALKKLGATRCFDYRDDDVVDQIKAFVRDAGTPLTRAFDTIGFQGPVHMSDKCFASCAENATVVSTIGNSKAIDCFASTAIDLAFDTPRGRLTIPARPADDEKTSRILEWVVGNLKTFRIPNVRLVAGDVAAREAILHAGSGKASFEKVVIEHPIAA